MVSHLNFMRTIARLKTNANYGHLMSDKVGKIVTKNCFVARVGHQVELKKIYYFVKQLFSPNLMTNASHKKILSHYFLYFI